MPFLIIFEMIFAILLYVTLIVLLIIVFRDMLVNRIPFVSTRRRALPIIHDALKMGGSSTCIDLGCGNAHVLRSLRKRYANARLVGYERGVLPFILARMFSVGQKIKVRYGDMYLADVSEASHIYVYTGTEAMKRFEVKLFRECAPGTRIVSLDFVFPNKQFIEHYPLHGGRFALAKDVYVYVV